MIRAAVRSVMTAARYATLVTLGADGQPQARVVDPLLSTGHPRHGLSNDARTWRPVVLDLPF